MIKNCLFALALLSLALTGGCAKGGNGIVPPPTTIDVTAPNGVPASALYPNQGPVTLTATVMNGGANTAVTWSLSGPTGTNCTGTPNPCGTLTPVTPATNPATATYTAPATPISELTVTATLLANPAVTGILALNVVDITTNITPALLNIGYGLTQTFTTVAIPDDAPQTFSWSCMVGANSCANFSQDSNVSGLAYYTAKETCTGNCVQISAVSTLDPGACSNSPNCAVPKITLVPYRVSGTYSFRFSGYDGSQKAIVVIGTFAMTNGTITSGAEEVLTSNGPPAQISIPITGIYTPTSATVNGSAASLNDAGTLKLFPSGVTQCGSPTEVYPCQFQAVLDGAGDIEMIESDNNGTGSGVVQKSSSSFTGMVEQTYAFGFTGVDSGGNRVGYAGLMGFNGAFHAGPPIVVGGVSGIMDVNDNGQSSDSVCSGTPPCTITGTYTQNANGSWHLALTSPVTMGFDFFVASGTTGVSNPLTLYAISTDPVTTNPAVSGTMVLQDSTTTYNNAAFKSTSVSALTGTVTVVNTTCTAPPCTNVSLTLGTADGNGNFSGLFDQNNAGAILSSVQFPPNNGTNNYTYAATGTPPIGRYTFNMLGNPTSTPVVAPVQFLLYASGANRGFLLEQGSSSSPDTSVMTGTMTPQAKGGGILSGDELPGTYAAATIGSGSSRVDPIAANLLFTWANSAQNPLNPAGCTSECVNGTQYDSVNYNPVGVPLTGASTGYSLQDTGNGTIALTNPTQNYVIYVVDTSGACTIQSPACAIQDFLMMDVDKTNPNASIIFAKQ
jgi:hypothetical protein